MSNVFLKVVNMSISASWLVLVVLILRVILKKAPKWVNVLLWATVAVRLICPVSLESAMSLVPSAETISTEIMINSTPVIHSGVTLIDNTVNPILDHSFMPEPNNNVNPLQILVSVLSTVWIVGIFVLLAYAAISYWRLCRQVSTAVLIRDNVFRSEYVTYPFVLGILWPKVYLPVELKKPDINYVVAHEYAHIRRRDYWWKPFGFVLLTVHWFNPLIWIAYVLFCKDIELACDEKVVKRMKRDDKAAYAQALLNCSDPRRRKIACPLAFGENGVKQRVKTVLHYKRPAFLIIFSAVIICVVVAVCFLTNPASAKEQGEDSVASGIDGDGGSGTDGSGKQPVDPEVSGALASEDDAKTLFTRMPDVFYFYSGAGGWFTELYLADDGNFTGLHFDADMGDADTQLFPNGTEYICEFSGAFAEPERVSDNVFSTHVVSLEYAPPETEAYVDGVRRITSTPYGIYNADEVLIYLPGYPVAELPDGVRGWLNSAEEFWDPEKRPSVLPFYVLSNVNEENAFFSDVQ